MDSPELVGKQASRVLEPGGRPDLVEALEDLVARELSARKQVLIHDGEVELRRGGIAGERFGAQAAEPVVDMRHVGQAGRLVVTHDLAVAQLDTLLES